MSDTILVTGGLGYVGGRIAKYLAENTSYSLHLSTRQHQQERPDWLVNGEIINMDLLDDKDLEEKCVGIKYIIHLAAINEIESLKDPAKALKVNGVGSLKLLQAAVKAGVERFIYFSTAHVYGAPLVGRITEKTLPRPQHPYAISHKTAEDFILAAHDRGDIEAIVFRLSNSFGMPERESINRWTLLVNDLCRQAATTGEVVLRSTGLDKRDFITLHDVARAVGHILTIPKEHCDNALFNLGGENTLRVIDMASLIAERYELMFGKKLVIKRQETNQETVDMKLDYCIDKLKSTGFILNSSIDKEIDETLLLCKRAFT